MTTDKYRTYNTVHELFLYAKRVIEKVEDSRTSLESLTAGEWLMLKNARDLLIDIDGLTNETTD